MPESLPLLCGVPNISHFGTVLFAIYVCSLASLLEGHGVSYWFYVDDTPFYFEIINLQGVKNYTVALLLNIRVWMHRDG